MYEIRTGMKKINDVFMDTFVRDIEEGEVSLEAEAGSTGLCGGDRKEGGRAYIRIRANTADFFASIKKDEKGRPCEMAIAVCGDEEILALIKALHFAHKALLEACAEVNE